MDSMTTDFGNVLLWSFWFFIWVAAIMVWFRCMFDMFGDHTLSGWGKAGWAILLIFVPWLGALIYLIARGRSMTERADGHGARRGAGASTSSRVAGTSSGRRADRQREVPARLRRHQPGRVRRPEGQGPRLRAVRQASIRMTSWSRTTAGMPTAAWPCQLAGEVPRVIVADCAAPEGSVQPIVTSSPGL